MNNVDENYTMTNIPDKPVLNINKAINYYLYDFMRRHYYEGNYKLARTISESMESACLDKEDRKGLMYLKRRLFIKKILRKQ